MTQQNFSANAGIAIGPILFVVAILAVLVGALAAGSGGFSSSTADDTKRVQATTIIQQGTTIKSAMDRLLVQGFDSSTIVVAPSYGPSNSEAALYSPNGGGLTPQIPPSTIVAPDAAWAFVNDADLPGIGATGPNDFIAIIEVKDASICKAVNGIIFGRSAAQTTKTPVPPSGINIVAKAVTIADGMTDPANAAPMASISGLSGRTQGCFSDASSGGAKFYYYQLLSAG